MLKPFDGFRCHLADTLVGLMTPGQGKLWGLNPRPKHAIVNCSQTVSLMLPPGEYKLGVGRLATAIPPSAKLRWSLLMLITSAMLLHGRIMPAYVVCLSVCCQLFAQEHRDEQNSK